MRADECFDLMRDESFISATVRGRFSSAHACARGQDWLRKRQTRIPPPPTRARVTPPSVALPPPLLPPLAAGLLRFAATSSLAACRPVSLPLARLSLPPGHQRIRIHTTLHLDTTMLKHPPNHTQVLLPPPFLFRLVHNLHSKSNLATFPTTHYKTNQTNITNKMKFAATLTALSVFAASAVAQTIQIAQPVSSFILVRCGLPPQRPGWVASLVKENLDKK